MMPKAGRGPTNELQLSRGDLRSEATLNFNNIRLSSRQRVCGGVKNVFNSSPVPSLNETREGNSKHCDFSRLVLGGSHSLAQRQGAVNRWTVPPLPPIPA